MGALQEIFIEYTRMRNNGLDAKTALATLRPYIEPLSKTEKDDLAQQLRAWETGNKETPPPAREETSARRSDVIKPLSDTQHGRPGAPIRSVSSDELNSELWVTCPNCSKKNRKTEVFCYACGQLLEPPSGQFDTRHFKEADEHTYNPDHFTPDSVLFLEVRSVKQYFEVRPQKQDHELVLGRSSSNSPMMPDIDLAQFQASDLGVSRLHLAMKFEPSDNAIHVHDLGSANGSFINGQRLHTKEKRVLRHGDELRLGRLVLRVYFRHPGEEIAG